jgi:polysaccharide deacetylase family protein (PEP-CTERM system associated)
VQTRGKLLLSIDLEDVRDHVRNGLDYSERVPDNTERYLRFMREHRVSATFFIVGLVAERYPGLIRDIISEGHEIACHSHTHIQLDRHTEQTFRDDLKRNLDVLYNCGAQRIVGFRAPTFSMIESTQWAYPVLEELGFEYSSSVIPARNPLYGWPQFGSDPRVVGKILEMPITLHPRFLRAPLAGGTYFRVLPFPLIMSGVKRLARQGVPIQSYLHPYEIDADQERFMHPDLSDNRWLNALMYIGRSRVLPRLDRLTELCDCMSYRDYLAQPQP